MNQKRILPEKTTCVSNDQLYSFAVAELSHIVLLIHSGVSQHYYLGCKEYKKIENVSNIDLSLFFLSTEGTGH